MNSILEKSPRTLKGTSQEMHISSLLCEFAQSIGEVFREIKSSITHQKSIVLLASTFVVSPIVSKSTAQGATLEFPRKLFRPAEIFKGRIIPSPLDTQDLFGLSYRLTGLLEFGYSSGVVVFGDSPESPQFSVLAIEHTIDGFVPYVVLDRGPDGDLSGAQMQRLHERFPDAEISSLPEVPIDFDLFVNPYYIALTGSSYVRPQTELMQAVVQNMEFFFSGASVVNQWIEGYTRLDLVLDPTLFPEGYAITSRPLDCLDYNHTYAFWMFHQMDDSAYLSAIAEMDSTIESQGNDILVLSDSSSVQGVCWAIGNHTCGVPVGPPSDIMSNLLEQLDADGLELRGHNVLTLHLSGDDLKLFASAELTREDNLNIPFDSILMVDISQSISDELVQEAISQGIHIFNLRAGESFSDARERFATEVLGVSVEHPYPPVIVSNFQLVAYPNPFNSSVNIQFSVPCAQNVTITCVNILGEEISVSHIYAKSGKNAFNFVPSADVASGLLVFHVYSDASRASEQVKIVYIK